MLKVSSVRASTPVMVLPILSDRPHLRKSSGKADICWIEDRLARKCSGTAYCRTDLGEFGP